MGELFDKAKGRVKQAAGDLADDPKLRREGQRDEVKGKIKGTIEDVKHEIKDKVD